MRIAVAGIPIFLESLSQGETDDQDVRAVCSVIERGDDLPVELPVAEKRFGDGRMPFCHQLVELRVRLTAALVHHPALEPRQRISLYVLEAAAHHRQGAEAEGRRHLRIALREAQTLGLMTVFIEDAERLERLLPGFVAEPSPGNARPVAFAASLLERLKLLPASPLRSKDLAGLSRQEHHVLCYIADGYSNKHTARALGLSESTVKFHLRSLFKKLAVRSRAELADAARARHRHLTVFGKNLSLRDR